MRSDPERDDKLYLKIYLVYKEILDKAGEYAPYLSKKYFIDNTIHECANRKIGNSGRCKVYEALKFGPAILENKTYLLKEIEDDTTEGKLR